MEPRRWQRLSIICAGVFLGAIDFYIVAVAVPDLLHSFRPAGVAEISWVFNGYTIAFTVALLPAGGLADRFGCRRVFLVGLGVFSLGALGCAVAPSPPALIAARLVQGIAGGTITPLALPLILPLFPAERRGYAIGLWSATQSAAIAAGPSVGGALVSAVGWRGVFLLQLPIGALALAGAAWALDRDRVTADASRPPDLAGVSLLAPSIALISLAIVQGHAWGALNWRTDVSLAGGLLFGVAFIRRSLSLQARGATPLIDIGLLKIRTVRRGSAVMLAAGLVVYALPAASILFLVGVVPAERLASGTSIAVVARAAGAVVSLAALALILSSVPDGTRALRAYHEVWAGMTGLAVVVFMASFGLVAVNAQNGALIRSDPGQAVDS